MLIIEDEIELKCKYHSVDFNNSIKSASNKVNDSNDYKKRMGVRGKIANQMNLNICVQCILDCISL